MVEIKYIFAIFSFFLFTYNISFGSIVHPVWIYKDLNYAYGHWEWFKEISIDDWIKKVKSEGANVLVLGQIPDKNLNYKWIKKIVKEAHKNNMKVIFYVNLKRVSLIKKDEWKAVNWKNKRVEYGDLCNKEYYSFIQDHLLKLIKIYKFDGYLIDMFFFDVPHGSKSKYCSDLFIHTFNYYTIPDYNKDIKGFTKKYYDWIEMHKLLRRSFLGELTKKAHEINPEFAIIVNQISGWKYNVSNNFLPIDIGRYVDGIMEEFGWEYKLQKVKPYKLLIKQIFQNKFLNSRKYGGISLSWYLTYPQSKDAIYYKAINSFSHGNIPIFTIGPNIKFMSLVWKDLESEKKSLFQNYKFNNPIAIVFSEKSLFMFHKYNETEDYIKNMLGITQILLDEYLPFDVISDRKLLNSKTINKYKVIILPNTTVISDNILKNLKKFVKNGGLIILTYKAGLFKDIDKKRKEIVLFSMKVEKDLKLNKMNWIFDKKKDFYYFDNLKDYRAWIQGRLQPLNYITVLPKNFNSLVGILKLNLTQEKSIKSIGKVGNYVNKKTHVYSPVFLLKDLSKGNIIFFPYDIGNLYYQNSYPAISKLFKLLILRFSQIYFPNNVKFNNYPIEINYLTKDKILFINHNIIYKFGSYPNDNSFNYIRGYLPSKVIINTSDKYIIDFAVERK